MADSLDMEAEEFDTSAAFYNAANKKKRTPARQTEAQSPARQKSADTGDTEETVEELDPAVLRSRQLAISGNEMANSGHYDFAIDLFTKAIKLDSAEFRFFGNRSYCYNRTTQYELALVDGERAIALAPQWATGYYRKGSALAGLKRYVDAEKSFVQVLKLDPSCDDAIQELVRVRIHQLKDMGFSWQQSEQAILQHNNVQQAVDSMLSGKVVEAWLEDVYVSDEENDSTEFSPAPPVAPPQPGGVAWTVTVPQAVTAPVGTPRAVTTPRPAAVTSSEPQVWPLATTRQEMTARAQVAAPIDIKMNPSNPEGLLTLWVGQIMPEVTKKRLVQMFSKYGEVVSVYRVPHRCCAFINFATKEGAGKAMGALQDAELAGKRLVLRFPYNPVTDGQSQTWKTTGTVSKTPANVTTKATASNPNGPSSLWVGNVKAEVTKGQLRPMFSKYGEVTSVKCLPEKFCAFINFKTRDSAQKAMAALQGTELAGKFLLIKFPDNPWS